MDPLKLTRKLVDIDSTTGNEGAVGAEIYDELCRLGYTSHKMAVAHERFNVVATLDERRPQLLTARNKRAGAVQANRLIGSTSQRRQVF